MLLLGWRGATGRDHGAGNMLVQAIDRGEILDLTEARDHAC